MARLSLGNSIQTISDTFLAATLYYDRFLHDPSFLDIHPCKTASKQNQQTAALITKAKKAFQRAAERVLTQKTTSGDIAPKPVSGALLKIAEEATLLISKSMPLIARASISPTGLSLAVFTCATFVLLDETTRSMAMDQISQVMALFQNEASEPKSTNGNKPTLKP